MLKMTHSKWSRPWPRQCRTLPLLEGPLAVLSLLVYARSKSRALVATPGCAIHLALASGSHQGRQALVTVTKDLSLRPMAHGRVLHHLLLDVLQ